MKKLNLNINITNVAGKPVSVAQLQRRIAPGTQTTASQESTVATMATIAFSAIEGQRGKQITDDQVKIAYSTLQKINTGITSNAPISLEDEEYALVEASFINQVVSIRAPFIAMVEALNADPISDKK